MTPEVAVLLGVSAVAAAVWAVLLRTRKGDK